MAYFLRINIKVFAYLAIIIGSIGFSGCVSKKGVVKESTLLMDEKKRERALVLFKEGADLLYQNNKDAYDKFVRASTIDETFYPAYYNAGVAAEAMGNRIEAAKQYELCLFHNKEQGSCLENLLLVKAKLGQLDFAASLAERYLDDYKDAPFAKVAAAKLALYQKDYALAEKRAREAIERDAANVEALFVMTWIFYERKEFSAAKWVAKNALEIAPSHGGLHLVLGHTEKALGLMLDAIDSYSLAVKFQPTEEALESYGLLLLKRGLAKDALSILKRLVEIRPNEARNYLYLGNAYFANRMFLEAKNAYVKFQELSPQDKDVDFNLGLLFYDLKPPEASEIERLKISQNYFKSYLEQSGLSKDRIKEVHNYLETLRKKIEIEEYEAQAEKEAIEEKAAEEKAAEEKAEEEKNEAIEEKGEAH